MTQGHSDVHPGGLQRTQSAQEPYYRQPEGWQQVPSQGQMYSPIYGSPPTQPLAGANTSRESESPAVLALQTELSVLRRLLEDAYARRPAEQPVEDTAGYGGKQRYTPKVSPHITQWQSFAKRVERSASYQRAVTFADRHSIEFNRPWLSTRMPRVTVVDGAYSQSKVQDEVRAPNDAQGASTSRPSNSAGDMSKEIGDASEPSLQSNEPTREPASDEQRQREAHAAPSSDKAYTGVSDATCGAAEFTESCTHEDSGVRQRRLSFQDAGANRGAAFGQAYRASLNRTPLQEATNLTTKPPGDVAGFPASRNTFDALQQQSDTLVDRSSLSKSLPGTSIPTYGSFRERPATGPVDATSRAFSEATSGRTRYMLPAAARSTEYTTPTTGVHDSLVGRNTSERSWANEPWTQPHTRVECGVAMGAEAPKMQRALPPQVRSAPVTSGPLYKRMPGLFAASHARENEDQVPEESRPSCDGAGTQPADAPPSHRHSWQGADDPCTTCGSDWHYFCQTCEATFCGGCHGPMHRPSYGPARPGPVPKESQSGDECAYEEPFGCGHTSTGTGSRGSGSRFGSRGPPSSGSSHRFGRREPEESGEDDCDGRDTRRPRRPSTKYLEKDLSSKEIEDHSLSIDIVDHDRQIERLMNYTRLKGPHLEEVATMGKARFKHEMAQPRDSYESAERVSELQMASRFFERTIIMCLKKDNDRVKNFLVQHYARTETGDIFTLVESLERFNAPKSPNDFARLSARFAQTEYLQMDMKADAIHVALRRLLLDFRKRPIVLQTPNAEYYAVLSKMPREAKSGARRIKEKIAELDFKGKKMEYQVFVGKLEIALIASGGRDQGDRATTDIFNSMQVMQACMPSDDDSASDSDVEEYDAAEFNRRGPMACFSCGKMMPEVHAPGECTLKCPNTFCQLAFCPKARDAKNECSTAMKRTLDPEKREQSAVRGKQVTPRMQRIMCRKQANYRAGKYGDGQRSKSSDGGVHSSRQRQNKKHERQVMDAGLEQYESDDSETDDSKDVCRAEFMAYEEVCEALLGGDMQSVEVPDDESTWLRDAKALCDAAHGKSLSKAADVRAVSELSEKATVGTDMGDEVTLDAAEAQQHTAVGGRKMRGVIVNALIDRGAQCNVLVLPGAERYADAVRNTRTRITGHVKGAAATIKHTLDVTVKIPGGDDMRFERFYDSTEHSGKILVNENALYAEHRAHVDTPSEELIMRSGKRVKLHKLPGDERFYLRMFFPIRNEDVPAQVHEVEIDPELFDGLMSMSDDEVTSAVHTHTLDAQEICLVPDSTVNVKKLVMAARMNVNARGYARALKAVDGLPEQMSTLSKEEARLVDADRYRRAAVMKQVPARKRSVPQPKQARTLTFDAWGPHAIASPVDGTRSQIHAVDTTSNAGQMAGLKDHTSATALKFVRSVVNEKRARGIDVGFVRFDRAGEYDSPAFREAIEEELHVKVEMSPSKFHQGVTNTEANHDILTRHAEIMLQRAGLGPSYLLPARMYAQHILWMRPMAGEDTTRYEAEYGTRPSLKNRLTMYLFGCDVLVLRDKSLRGPHGSVDNGRTFTGRLLGIDGESYIVEKKNGQIVYPHHVTPLNEVEMVRRGLPTAREMVDVEVQTVRTRAGTECTAMGAITERVESASSHPAATDGHDVHMMNAGVRESVNAPQNGERRVMHDGHSINILLIYGGREDAPDGFKARVMARYPRAYVHVVDLKSGRVEDDMLVRANRVGVLRSIQPERFDMVFIATPCKTWTHCGIEYRTKERLKGVDVRGNKKAMQELREGDVLTDFTLTVLETCEQRGIEWGVECSAQRGQDEWTNESDDAYWEEMAHVGYFWDLPRCKQLCKVARAKRYKVAMCKQGMRAQKYIEVMLSEGMRASGDEWLEPLFCDHTEHAVLLQGRDDAGRSLAEWSENYTPEFSDTLAEMCTRPFVPQDEDCAGVPPFSGKQHEPAARVTSRAQLEALVAELAEDEHEPAFYEKWECAEAAAACSRGNRQGNAEWIRVPRLHKRTTQEEVPQCYMRTQAGDVLELQVCKADRNEVEILTPLGWQKFKVPRSAREVQAAWDSVLWIEADRKAHDAIIKAGNRLIRRDAVPADAIIMNVVTARKYKKDGATGRLVDHNARKSRHSADGARKAAVLRSMGVDPQVNGVSNIVDPLGLKLFLAYAAKWRMRLLKADIGDAYAKAQRKRARGYMRMCKTVQEYDDDGMEMLYELLTPLWGEQEAGFEWDDELHQTLTHLGWMQVPGIPALYVNDCNGTQARLIKIVDDLLIAESGDDLVTAQATVTALKAKYDGQVTHEEDPQAFAGYKLERGPQREWLKISQPQKIIDAVTTHVPWIRDATADAKAPPLAGAKLQQRLDELVLEPLAAGKKPTPAGKKTQAATGSAKYFEQGVCPALSVHVHRLSSVMSNPPEGALECAQGVIAQAHEQLEEGITYYAQQREPSRVCVDGRMQMDLAEGAPSGLEAAADASTAFPRILIGMLLTFAGGSVLHKTKKLAVVLRDMYVAGIMVKDVFEAELVATVAMAQEVAYARRFLSAMGEVFDAPTTLLTDSLSGARVLNNVRSAARSKTVLWRCAVVQAMARAGEVAIVHVPDASNPADFLTKWLAAAKVRASDEYARGVVHRGM